MAPGPLDAIYFDSLAQLASWHDNLSTQKQDSAWSKLNLFRRATEDLDAYQIGDPTVFSASALKAAGPRLRSSNSVSAVNAPSTSRRASMGRLSRVHSNATSLSRNFFSKYLSTSPHSRSPSSVSSTSSMLSDISAADGTAPHHSPKLMVCHDFKNGYQDGHDRATTGYYPHGSGQRYLMQYPQLVDSFIYFSHHRVTVPPASWINTCHRNCIKCFGTIIFEGSSYSADLDKLVQVGKRDGKFVYVDMLAELVSSYGFDGYLLNVETRFSNSRIAAKLLPFIECLKARLHSMNTKNEVIWYDSYLYPFNRTFYVNGVSELNHNFFSAADSLFTNYWWTSKTLKENLRQVGRLGVGKKLYVGYDVWGRGSNVGKGGFDSSLACQMISKYLSNIALFAPAWTYEQLGARNFEQNDTRFWVGLFDDEFSVMSSVKPHSTPVFKINDSSFVFYTNFSNGQGKHFFCKGVKVFDQPWVDGNLQRNFPLTVHQTPNMGLQMRLDTLESFNGGSSLQVSYVPYLEDRMHGSSGFRIYSEQQVRHLVLFDFNKRCRFNTVGVKVSYRLKQDPEMVFKVKVKYRVEKYASGAVQTRVGYLVVPLCTTGGSWYTLDNAFNIDTEIMEHIVLECVEIGYDSESMGQTSADTDCYRSYIVEDSVVTSVIDNEQYEKVVDEEIYEGDEDEGWVMIPKADVSTSSAKKPATTSSSASVPDAIPVLKIGEIAIINANNYPCPNLFALTPVRKVSKSYIKSAAGNLFTWDASDTNYMLYYIVYINDTFRGTSQVPQFFLPTPPVASDASSVTTGGLSFASEKRTLAPTVIKIRVDTLDRLGVVYPGSEIYIN